MLESNLEVTAKLLVSSDSSSVLCAVPLDFTDTFPFSLAQGQQKNIMDYFKISQTQQAVAGRTKNISIKEELLDPFFAEDDESNISNVMEISGDSSSFLEDECMENSRKRPLSSTAPSRLQIENDLWGEPEKKAVVVHPELSQIKQELDDEIEIEPVPDAHYGLLGTRNWEIPQGSIEDLPDEVLRIIFAFLPVTDLCQNLSLVCHHWRIIVSDPRVRTAATSIRAWPFSYCPALSQSCGCCMPVFLCTFKSLDYSLVLSY